MSIKTITRRNKTYTGVKQYRCVTLSIVTSNDICFLDFTNNKLSQFAQVFDHQVMFRIFPDKETKKQGIFSQKQGNSFCTQFFAINIYPRSAISKVCIKNIGLLSTFIDFSVTAHAFHTYHFLHVLCNSNNKSVFCSVQRKNNAVVM